MSNSLQRILFALIAIPVVVGIVYWGGLPLALLITAAALVGTREFFLLAERRGIRPIWWLGLLMAAAFPLGAWWRWGGLITTNMLAWASVGDFVAGPYLFAILMLGVLTVTLLSRRPDEQPLGAAAVTLLGPLYCSGLLSFVLGIRYATGPHRHWPATWIVFFPLAITWICDTAAMYGGRAFQGPKLWPSVSPGKTRSGSLAGLVAGVLAALLYARLALVPSGIDLPLTQVIVIGVVIAIAAQIGDLAESLFKREAGVKDSSGLIPGHGGLLDRLDALYFVLPTAAILYRIFGII